MLNWIVNVLFIAVVAALCWMQIDTWKEARETNRFIGQLLQHVGGKP